MAGHELRIGGPEPRTGGRELRTGGRESRMAEIDPREGRTGGRDVRDGRKASGVIARGDAPKQSVGDARQEKRPHLQGVSRKRLSAHAVMAPRLLRGVRPLAMTVAGGRTARGREKREKGNREKGKGMGKREMKTGGTFLGARSIHWIVTHNRPLPWCMCVVGMSGPERNKPTMKELP